MLLFYSLLFWGIFYFLFLLPLREKKTLTLFLTILKKIKNQFNIIRVTNTTRCKSNRKKKNNKFFFAVFAHFLFTNNICICWLSIDLFWNVNKLLFNRYWKRRCNQNPQQFLVLSNCPYVQCCDINIGLFSIASCTYCYCHWF